MSNSRAGRDPEDDKSVPLSPGKTYFLGIGINAYQHWPKLRNAVRDVEAIATLLTTDFGLAPEHSTLLLDDQATEEQIIHQLEVMADTVTESDSLLIYYAGHGYLHRGIRGFWVPVDAPRRKIPRLIRNSTIRDYIGDIPSLHTLLISDSCFSGALFVRGQRKEELEVDELASLPSRWAITSGRKDEPVSDGPEGGHSPFAQSILDVLRSSTRDRITANFLYEQVREQTIANGYQMPDGGPLAGVAHKRGQYVFQRVQDKASLQQPAAIPASKQPDHSPTRPTAAVTSYRTRSTWWSLESRRRWLLFIGLPILVLGLWQLVKILGGPGETNTTVAKPDMVNITGGPFRMGDTFGEGDDDEIPVHPVAVSDYQLGRFQVTFSEYDNFCEANNRPKPNDQGWGRSRRPIINISWLDAVAYCNWLSKEHKYRPVYQIKGESVTADWQADGYRLPTEAEWEYAARNQGGNDKWAGTSNENELSSFANYDGIGDGFSQTAPVGSMQANDLGLHDMSGNVWEWCWDWYGSYYYHNSPQHNPHGPDSGNLRVFRGGSWCNPAKICRATDRSGSQQTSLLNDVGFRLARSP